MLPSQQDQAVEKAAGKLHLAQKSDDSSPVDPGQSFNSPSTCSAPVLLDLAPENVPPCLSPVINLWTLIYGKIWNY